MSSLPRVVLSLAILAATLTGTACGDPPDKEMQQAQGAIDAARAAGADRYAPAEYVAAQAALKRATEAVEQRDYRLALNHALDARERAQAAAKEAADHKATARTDAEHAITQVSSTLNEAHARLKATEAGHAPPKTAADARREIEAGDAAVQEARTAFDHADYLGALDALQGVTARLRASTHDLEPAAPPPPRRRR